MLNRLFVLGLIAAVFSLVSPCQAAPAVESDANTLAHSEVGASGGIISLDQFNPNGILPDGDPVGELQGALLILTVRLNSGRIVLDNENPFPVTVVKLWIGGTLGVVNEALNVHYEASPLKEATNVILAKDVDVTGSNPYDGKWPEPEWSPAVLDQYSGIAPVELDKLAAIIRPDNPDYSFSFTHTYTAAADLAIFTGTGEVGFAYNSTLNEDYDTGGQDVNEWTGTLTFDVEAQVVYLYASSPEPASMGLLAAAFVPVLARRLRKRKSLLS